MAHVLRGVDYRKDRRVRHNIVIRWRDGLPKSRDEPWFLMTDLDGRAERTCDLYGRRMSIETFHKVLKSGYRADQSKLRTAERLTNLLAVFCVIGWRVFWLTMTNRATPEAPAEVALTKAEVEILDRLAGDTGPRAKPTVAHYLVAIARLGGYLARAKDPPRPGTPGRPSFSGRPHRRRTPNCAPWSLPMRPRAPAPSD
jgi:hypothetical protein